MCYSFNTSILSYSIGMMSAIFALCTNQIILGFLILFYSQMQLSEAIIWKGIDTKNKSLNEMGTMYGKYLLPTHNIAIAMGILIVVGHSTFWDYLPFLLSLLFYGIILYIYHIKKYPNVTYPIQKCKVRKCQNDKNRLQWPFPIRWYIVSFIFSLFLLVIYIRPISSQIFLGLFFLLTFLGALFFFPQSMGSVWCFSTAILSPLVVIINYFLVH